MDYSNDKECTWLFEFATIREKLHKQAGVELHHVNEKEAEKYLNRLKDQQRHMQEKAQKEE